VSVVLIVPRLLPVFFGTFISFSLRKQTVLFLLLVPEFQCFDFHIARPSIACPRPDESLV
jgi:hypothetical protein